MPLSHHLALAFILAVALAALKITALALLPGVSAALVANPAVVASVAAALTGVSMMMITTLTLQR